MVVLDGERGDTEGTGHPENFQHRGGCSGESGPVESIRSPEGTSWVVLGISFSTQKTAS